MVTAGAETIEIDVVLALPDHAWRRVLRVEPGTTAGQALALSGLAEFAGEAPQLGVFGRKVKHDYIMQRGERLELYRPLIADPRQRRRRRADAKKT